MLDENKFLQDGVTPNPDYCPNPAVAQIAAFEALKAYFEAEECKGRAEGKAYTDSEASKLKTIIDQNTVAINVLTNGQATAAQLAAIDSLLAEVDFNGDGQVEELATLFTKINDAVAKIDGFQAELDAVKALNAEQTTQITNLGTSVSTAVADASEAKSKAQEALDAINNIEPVIEQEFNKYVDRDVFVEKFVDKDIFKTKIRQVIVEGDGVGLTEAQVIALIEANPSMDEAAVRALCIAEATAIAVEKATEIAEAKICEQNKAIVAGLEAFTASLTGASLSCPVDVPTPEEGAGGDAI